MQTITTKKWKRKLVVDIPTNKSINESQDNPFSKENIFRFIFRIARFRLLNSRGGLCSFQVHLLCPPFPFPVCWLSIHAKYFPSSIKTFRPMRTMAPDSASPF